MDVLLPKNVKNIINTLETCGFEAYAVGGCVRDLLLLKTPHDWDITTSATPCDVKRIFKKTFDTGIKHGTVSVLYDNEIFEVTTFRSDGEYKDNRHPKSVSFTTSLEEDLKRRDFTINAFAFNEKSGLVDLFSGFYDLQNKIIRCVGNPDKRFCEDALRILRAVRFSAQLGFEIETNTKKSIIKNAHLVQNLSEERIISEITKILIYNPFKLKDLYDFGILSYIMPEMQKCFKTTQNIKWHIYDVGMHTLNVVNNMPKIPYLRFCALMHDWGKPYTKAKNEKGEDTFRNHAKVSVDLASIFMKKYKFSNADTDKILTLIKNHDREIIPEKKYVKRAICAIGFDLFLDFVNLKRADCLSQNLSLTKPRLKIYDEYENLFNEIKSTHEPFCVKDLKINGNDIKNLGFYGKEIGDVLKFLLDKVLDNPDLNEKEKLLEISKSFKN